MIGAALSWLAASRAGRWIALAGAGAILLIGVRRSGVRKGEDAATRRVLEDNLEAREGADEEASRYRADGGARGRLRDGTF